MIGDDRWPELLPVDPRPWLLACDDPAARWVTLTHLLDVDPGDVNATAAHDAAVASPNTDRLIKMLNGWQPGDVVAVRDARFRPNVLNLLADMGLGPEDDARIRKALADFMDRRDADGRFLSPQRGGAWVANECDHCAVTDTRLHFGASGNDRAVALIQSEFSVTTDGRGWGHAVDGSVEFCPTQTLLALRVLSQVGSSRRPRRIREAVRTLLKLAVAELQNGSDEFLLMRWPSYGYAAFPVLDVASRYVDVWEGSRARPEDRRHIVELTAEFVSRNFDDHGAVVVKRPSTGFATLPMARRNEPSPLATAIVCVTLRRLEPLVDEVIASSRHRPLAGAR